jgi:hypothetical protein
VAVVAASAVAEQVRMEIHKRLDVPVEAVL